jgi:coenzyme PQQ precursor peptide PqqA
VALRHAGYMCGGRDFSILQCKSMLQCTLIKHFVFRKLLANLCAGIRVGGCSIWLQTRGRQKMAWKSPKIVEVAVGMEINMYACAARK